MESCPSCGFHLRHHRHRHNCLVVHLIILHRPGGEWETLVGCWKDAGFEIDVGSAFARVAMACHTPRLLTLRADLLEHRRSSNFRSTGTLLEGSEY